MKNVKVLFLLTVALVLIVTGVTGCSEDSSVSIGTVQNIGMTSDDPSEGITVHGHWTIEVRNPDGTLVESREFENALVSTGDERIAEILARVWSVGGWMVSAGNTALADNPFFDPDELETIKYCQIMEPAGTISEPYMFNSLSVGTGDGSQVVLNGTAIAQKDGSVNQVHTLIGRVANTSPPAPSYDLGSRYFTTTTLASPADVSEGQHIVFTVVLSFS